MQYDPTPRTGEIITPVNATTPGQTTEPTMTLSQLQGLLREAAALERARRPIVIRPSAETHPAPTNGTYPARGAAGHQGVDLDLRNVVFLATLPANVAPLPQVPETRSLAPLAFLVSGTAFVASAFGTAVTGGNPLLIASTLGLLTATGAAFSRIVGNGVNR